MVFISNVSNTSSLVFRLCNSCTKKLRLRPHLNFSKSSSVFAKCYGLQRRSYIVLAIESSCDDSTVALIDRQPGGIPPRLIEHSKKSLDNTAAGGIIPLDARNHHQTYIAPMVKDLLKKHNIKKPDLICATRGPGMIGSLSAGYNLAKGLAVAWDVPLVGVHHMLGHLLTPRFFQSQENNNKGENDDLKNQADSHSNIPQYPFVSLLVSGGHTMLVLSESTTKHKILANTMDIAIGDMLDKCARDLGITGSMLAKEMEAFINEGPLNKSAVDISLQFPNPLQNKQGRINVSAYSFAGFITSLRINIEKYFPGVKSPATELSVEVRRELARRIQHAIFNHVVTKSYKALETAIDLKYISYRPSPERPLDFVCAGGVASNMTLRRLLHEKLQKKFYLPQPKTDSNNNNNDKDKDKDLTESKVNKEAIRFYYPPPMWCTDNALMVGWAGIELWESCGLYTDLSALPTAKWSIEDVLEMPGWLYRD